MWVSYGVGQDQNVAASFLCFFLFRKKKEKANLNVCCNTITDRVVWQCDKEIPHVRSDNQREWCPSVLMGLPRYARNDKSFFNLRHQG
ncbi:MAG TPA: hypothetical protein VHA56_12420 [Mucilaginibacter sp.]|nr:hypothetical protein [Mucilaginibacter sp.]